MGRFRKEEIGLRKRKQPGPTIWLQVGRFFWVLSSSVYRHDILSLAAGISFYAFFSLFPLLLLILYAVSVLLPNTHTEHVLTAMIRPYFPATGEAGKFITENVTRLAENGSRIGWLSAITLMWSATSGFIAVQQAFDVIWELRQQRSYWIRRLIGFGMLVALLLLTMLSAIVTALYPAFLRSALARAEFLHFAIHINDLSRELFPISLFIGFLVLYRYLPSKPIPWIWGVPGAAVATIAMDFGRQLFVWWASHLITYQIIYGGLTAVILLLLWMYVGSSVMLFGAEVASSLQTVIEIQPEDHDG